VGKADVDEWFEADLEIREAIDIRGGKYPGISLSPTFELKGPLPLRAKSRFRHTKYLILEDKSDALLSFGKHSGKFVSAVASIEPDYLRWILKEEFSADLKEVVDNVLNGTKPVDMKFRGK